MADPHIQSPMDFIDYLTVIIYRSGFVVATIMLFLLPYYADIATQGLLIAGVMLASSLHLYAKSFRMIFQFSAWLGLLCAIFNFPLLALGAMLLVIGGLSYKEYFCFRVFGLNFQPLFVAVLWSAVALDLSVLVQILSVICGLLLLILSIQKWRMPLHFDIGDKSKYQI
ncbi:DUF2301 domain-containing membrane protein [Mannheimia sp. AT1]|uniref:DUF2301 domain-containing membrane protein n=1 Tax=Mannheimia cairinae TaxID=3025936 RepID=A0ABT5MNV7_9PAST|nr:DUF2301 domain-containing membrane protein [Mannheimia cairinae]MDD0823775.1 DUF2301 domain-containing membrane protein [Mannheimia cairinae]MDD0825091.1 DUF2301 domain-containing membrane protein [Mannheimia cairinae]